MRPASVMTIEMTNASRGRSMKTVEITGSARRRRTAGPSPAPTWPGRTFCTPSTITLSPSLHAGFDDDIGALLRAGLDAPLLDLVLAVDDQHVMAGLVDLERRLRASTRRGSFLRALNTTVTNSPSTSSRSGLGTVARMVRVSVCWSTWGSVKFQTAAMRIVLAVRQPHQDLDLGRPAVRLATVLADVLELALR